MLRSALIIFIACAFSTAAGACEFVARDGAIAEFASPMELVMTGPDGSSTKCAVLSSGTGVDVQSLDCDGWRSALFFAPAIVDGSEDDLLIAGNTIWYKRCPA